MWLVTSAQMRAIDRETIDRLGVPGPTLMENAGRAVAEKTLSLLRQQTSKAHVAVFCGKGNNGGDGFVAARYLHQAEQTVSAYFIGPSDQLSPDAKLNHDRAAQSGVSLKSVLSADDLPSSLQCDIILDAVFGTGFTGTPNGLPAAMIDCINGQSATVIAIDLPSGLNADTGGSEGAAVRADYTLTLAQPKYGLFLSPGRELAGSVHVLPIGIPDEAVEQVKPSCELITLDVVRRLLPERKPDGHKGDFGKLLILAGSTGLTGAAALATIAAARSGCGMVRLGCPQSQQPILAVKLTEVMTVPLPDVARKGALALRGLGQIKALFREHDALVIGPGIGRHHDTQELIRRLVSQLDRPAILDADVFSALEGRAKLLTSENRPATCPAPVLTPHRVEFQRLTGEVVPDNTHDTIALVREIAMRLKVVLVLKGSPTIVADQQGRCFLNPTGNSGMATGGSGDVLSGMIGSFLAQGMASNDAAVCGVYLHGLAGDIAAESLTPRGMIAGDMITCLPKAFLALEHSDDQTAVRAHIAP